MPYQIPFIEENLPHSDIIIDETNLSTKFQHPICYVYDIGQYRLDSLVNNDGYKYPIETPMSVVKFEHNGVVQSLEKIDKLSVFYDYAKDFENVYDYNHPESRISKVLIKNKIIAYHFKHKLLFNTNGKNAKNIVNCIKNNICKNLEANKTQNAKDIKKNILKSNEINIDKFMKYLVENYDANVKAIYAGNLPQRENKAIAIYGDEADKSHLYEFIKNQGNTLSCITTKLVLRSSSTPKNILFTDNGGIMVFGNLTEELAIKIILEASELIEEFLNNATYN